MKNATGLTTISKSLRMHWTTATAKLTDKVFMYVSLCLWVVMDDKPYLVLGIKNMHPQHLRPYMEAAIETVLTCKIYL